MKPSKAIELIILTVREQRVSRDIGLDELHGVVMRLIPPLRGGPGNMA
jgi:hypothetical protein